MNKRMHILMFLLLTVVLLHGMDMGTLHAPAKALTGSTCTYDLGLENEYQVDWGSDETLAFIQALKNKAIVISSKDQKMYFSTSDKFAYFYTLKAASNKFNIMETNVKANKTADYTLQCIFLNKDIEPDFGVCKKHYKNHMFKLVKQIRTYKDKEFARCFWIMIGEKLRSNRQKLKQAFNSQGAEQIKKALRKPLFVEQFTCDDVKKIWYSK